MAIFLTGSTGYIGSHIAAVLLERHTDRLNLLVRAKTEQEANERLWHALQLHLIFLQFQDALETRIPFFAATSPIRNSVWTPPNMRAWWGPPSR